MCFSLLNQASGSANPKLPLCSGTQASSRCVNGSIVLLPSKHIWPEAQHRYENQNHAQTKIHTSFFKVTFLFPKWSSLKPWKGHLGVRTRSLGRSWWVFLICVCLFPLCFHYDYFVWFLIPLVTLAYLLDSANSEGWDSWNPMICVDPWPKQSLPENQLHYFKIFRAW